MGASDLTTEAPGAGNGEVVDGDRAVASNGNVAKKRKRQKALAAVAANGHVSKVVQRKPAGSNGAVVDEGPPAELPGEPGDLAPQAATVEVPAVEELDDADAEPEIPVGEATVVEELDDAEAEHEEDDAHEEPTGGGRRARRRAAKHAKAGGEEAPRGRAAQRAKAGGRRARRRAAKRAKAGGEEAAPRGRAAKRAKAAELETPAARRASLVATAAEIAAAAAEAESQPAPVKRRRIAKVSRRLVAVLAIAMVPASVYALVIVDGPSASLSRADASYMSAQLMTADQRVRRQLVRLKPMQTSAAVARTRDATFTARSLLLELDNASGRDAELLRRALRLESAWLDAVGSVLSNPRSPLRDELVARDAVLRPALDALPVPEGRRKGGAEHLVRYAESRLAANRSSSRS